MATYRDPYLYCHECKRWVATIDDDHGGFTCADCGETILCDECGQPWIFGVDAGHESHAIAKQKAEGLSHGPDRQRTEQVEGTAFHRARVERDAG